MPRDFKPDDPDDRQLLRDIIKALGKKGTTRATLFRGLVKHANENREYSPIGRNSFYAFVKGTDDLENGTPKLIHMWDYLTRHSPHHKFIVEKFGLHSDEDEPAPAADAPSDPDSDLANALMHFFNHKGYGRNITKIESIASEIAGQYIMYRPDIRPVSDPQKLWPNGLIRASYFDISNKNGLLFCKETQETAPDEYGCDNYQINFGPIFAYEEKIFFIMKGENNISFKFGILEITRDWNDKPTPWFMGDMMVSSNFGLFPCVKFFCMRNDKNYKTGILKYNDLPDKEVQRTMDRFFDNWNKEKNKIVNSQYI